MATSEGNYKVCVNEAQSFLSVAEQILKNGYEHLLDGSMYPFVVNLSFSCELFMKAIMIFRSVSNEFERGHELLKLFQLLPASDQSDIERIYSAKGGKTLHELLATNNNTFQEWRYALEGPVEINLSAMRIFAQSLGDYVSGLN